MEFHGMVGLSGLIEDVMRRATALGSCELRTIVIGMSGEVL